MLYEYIMRTSKTVSKDEDKWLTFELQDREAALRKAIELTNDCGQWEGWFADWIFETNGEGKQTASIPCGDYLLESDRLEIDPQLEDYKWDEEK